MDEAKQEKANSQEGKPLDEEVIVSRLMEKGEAERWRVECTGNIKFLVGNDKRRHPGVRLLDLVEHGLEHLFDSILFEGHRAFRMQAIVKPIRADGPMVVLFLYALEGDLLAHGVLALRLVEGKDGFGREVLVHLHIIV